MASVHVRRFEEPGHLDDGVFLDVVPRVAPVEFEVPRLSHGKNSIVMEVDQTGETFVVERGDEISIDESDREANCNSGGVDLGQVFVEEYHCSTSTSAVARYLPLQLTQWESHVKWGNTEVGETKSNSEQILSSGMNKALMVDSWHHKVAWDNLSTGAQHAPLLLNLNDRDMNFNVGKTEHPKLIERQAGDSATVSVAELEMRTRMAEEKMVRLAAAARNTGFNYNADTTLTFGKTAQQERAMPVQIPRMAHAQPAADKTLFKPPKLDDVKHFHRPRIPKALLTVDTVWSVRCPKKKAHGQGMSEAVKMRGGVILSQMRRDKDLVLTNGHFVLIEYIEEHPPLLSSLGMCSRIINWWRSSGSKSGTSHSFGGSSGGGGEELSPPELSEGQTRVLQPLEETPFIAEIKAGKIQPSICNDLFRAPLFQHVPRPTDFLLVSAMSQQDKKRHSVAGDSAEVGGIDKEKPATIVVTYIRPIQSVFLAGQEEPQREVYEPGSSEMRSALSSFLSYHLGRLFEGSTGEIGVDFNKVKDMLKFMGPPPKDLLKPVMKEVAVQRSYHQRWFRRPGVDLHSFVESAAYKFSPEDVCAFESMLCTHRRLRDLGIRHLISAESVAKVLISLKTRHGHLQTLVSDCQRACKAADSNADAMFPISTVTRLKAVRQALEAQLKELERIREVAQFIHENLQLCPWVLTSSFVKHHMQSQGNGMMRLTGLGDPSGTGEGFSFLPRPQEASKPQAKKTDINLDQLAMRKVTGTSADLRKLNMRELEKQLMDLGMEKEVVAPLHRWDRVRMISVLANKAVLGNTEEAASVMRFTRKHRHSTAWGKRLYNNNCQEIWERQAQALSLRDEDVQILGADAALEPQRYDATVGNKPASEGDEGSDDDDGLGDLLQDIEKEGETRDGEEITGEKRRMADFVRRAPTNASEAAARDEERAYREMKRQLALENKKNGAAVSAPGATGPMSGADNPFQASELSTARFGMRHGMSNEEAEEYEEVMASLGPRLPSQVVREIRRKVLPDGSEVIRIRYLFSPSDVVKVDREESVRDNACVAVQTPLGYFIPSEDNLKDAVSRRREASLGTPRETPKKGSGGVASTKINLSKLVSQVQKHKEQKKRIRLANQKDEADLYRGPKKTSRNRSRSRGSNAPRVQFSQKLVAVVDNLLKRVDSGAFRAPVSKRLIPEYHKVIKKPMDLGTMRNKANQGTYRTADAFLADLAQMNANAAEFNGPSHPLTLAASKILEDGQHQIQAQSDFLLDLVSQMNQTAASSAGKKVKKQRKVGNSSVPNKGAVASGGDARSFGSALTTGSSFGGMPEDMSSDSGEEMVVMGSTIR